MQNLKLKTKKISKGFTLIELLIVIAIIGVLATLLMVNFVGVRQRARDAQRKSDLRQIQSALEIYRSDNVSYPSYPSGTLRVTDLFSCSPGSGSKCTNPAGCFGNSSPTCSTVYMQNLPVDPSGGNYYYSSSDGSTYILGSCLENIGDSQKKNTSPGTGFTCTSGAYYVLNNP